MGRQNILDRTVSAIPQSALSFFEPVILISHCFFLLCLKFAAFSKHLLPILTLWLYPAFCSRGHKITLSLPFSSRPPSLLTTNKAIWHERCSSSSPTGRSRSALSYLLEGLGMGPLLTIDVAGRWTGSTMYRDTRHNAQTAPQCFMHAQFHNETGCFANHCCCLWSYVCFILTKYK